MDSIDSANVSKTKSVRVCYGIRLTNLANTGE